MRREFAIVIPARYASTRFPGKPLAPLKGASGIEKSLIQRSWECAQEVPDCVGVWVATDDERIAAEVSRFGGKVVMTSPNCRNGTERCADAVRQLPELPDMIVNLQGDAPLTPVMAIPGLVDRLASDDQAAMVTPAVRCSSQIYAHLCADEAAGRVGGTTVVFDQSGRALYFSKRILPYIPVPTAVDADALVHLHLGIYAYRQSHLMAYASAAPSKLELIEGLEQLRFLELGLQVGIMTMESPGWEPVELNNPSDVQIIEKVLLSRDIS